jgi:hypothetical protein
MLSRHADASPLRLNRSARPSQRRAKPGKSAEPLSQSGRATRERKIRRGQRGKNQPRLGWSLDLHLDLRERHDLGGQSPHRGQLAREAVVVRQRTVMVRRVGRTMLVRMAGVIMIVAVVMMPVAMMVVAMRVMGVGHLARGAAPERVIVPVHPHGRQLHRQIGCQQQSGQNSHAERTHRNSPGKEGIGDPKPPACVRSIVATRLQELNKFP